MTIYFIYLDLEARENAGFQQKSAEESVKRNLQQEVYKENVFVQCGDKNIQLDIYNRGYEI